MTIAEVSRAYGLTADTLRYYERVGLLPHVHRNQSGIRDYTEQDCGWVEFIKCMRGAGIQVEALIEYVELFQQGASTQEARKQILIKNSIFRNSLIFQGLPPIKYQNLMYFPLFLPL